jgi:hypothetical protein
LLHSDNNTAEDGQIVERLQEHESPIETFAVQHPKIYQMRDELDIWEYGSLAFVTPSTLTEEIQQKFKTLFVRPGPAQNPEYVCSICNTRNPSYLHHCWHEEHRGDCETAKNTTLPARMGYGAPYAHLISDRILNCLRTTSWQQPRDVLDPHSIPCPRWATKDSEKELNKEGALLKLKKASLDIIIHKKKIWLDSEDRDLVIPEGNQHPRPKFFAIPFLKPFNNWPDA